MYCPRLDHFVRFNANGTLSRCGHMVHAPEFASLEQMETSVWLERTKNIMMQGLWPTECVRCQETDPDSIRRYAENTDENTARKDYLQVGGVLDNICNAACLSCDERHSTRIGSLSSRTFPIVNNFAKFRDLPQDRIVHLDINGGEPSYSKNYKWILENLPPELKTLRLNTNASTVLTELTGVAQRGIDVTVTVSCDGVGSVHELLRWPIPWTEFYTNVMTYKSMPIKLNLWTTVSVLNEKDLPNIQAFARDHGIEHSWAYLKRPHELSIGNTDTAARDRYIRRQKDLRGIE